MTFSVKSSPDKVSVISYIAQLPEGKDYDIEIVLHKDDKASRTNQQNKLYWMWIRLISKETGNDIETLDKVFCKMFLGIETEEVFGQKIAKVKSSKTLKTDEMSEYLSQVEAYASTKLGIALPHPDDAYYEQLSR